MKKFFFFMSALLGIVIAIYIFYENSATNQYNLGKEQLEISNSNKDNYIEAYNFFQKGLNKGHQPSEYEFTLLLKKIQDYQFFVDHNKNTIDIPDNMKLGKYLFQHITDWKSYPHNYEIFLKQANNNYAPAQYTVGFFNQMDGYLSEAISWYEKAAKQNELKAILALGNIYKNWDKEVLENIHKARSYFKKSLSLGDKSSQDSLNELKKDEEVFKFIEVNKKKCNHEDADACNRVMEYYISNDKPTKAMYFADKNCMTGNSKMCISIGFEYFFNKSFDGNISKTINYFQRGCLFGNSKTCSIVNELTSAVNKGDGKKVLKIMNRENYKKNLNDKIRELCSLSMNDLNNDYLRKQVYKYTTELMRVSKSFYVPVDSTQYSISTVCPYYLNN